MSFFLFNLVSAFCLNIFRILPVTHNLCVMINSVGTFKDSHTHELYTASVFSSLSVLIVTCCSYSPIQQLTDRSQKLDDITNAVLKALTDSCTECGITNNIIDIPSFLCYPKSHTYVTYRAILEGTSEIDSGSLISLIEKWVSGRPSISVTGILMTVDPECPVAISSLSEEECLLIKPTSTAPTTSATGDRTSISQSSSTTSSITDTTDSTTSSSPQHPSSMTIGTTDSTTSSSPQSPLDNTAIIGGVVAIVFILVIGIIIVVAIIGIINIKLRSHGAINKE